MTLQSLRIHLSATLFLLANAAHAATPAGAALQRFLEDVQSLQAEFSQTQSDEQGRVTQTSKGQMWLQRASGKADDAGRFRWNYAEPYVQEIVCDGQRIWLYDPDLAQVTVRPAQEALAGTPAALLSQRTALTRDYEVREDGVEAGWPKLLLLPKSQDSEFKRIELWFDGDVPARLRFEDPLGGSTEIRFSATRSNPSLKASLFDFKPPKGVEVVEAGAQ